MFLLCQLQSVSQRHGVFQRVEAQYALFENGILNDEVWQLRRRYIRGLINIPLIAEIWQASKANGMFTQAFIAEIDTASNSSIPHYVGDSQVDIGS
ncbi:MAG: hypothetical protein COA47_00135 [Robiginitomaculum sp.]|nr:MAG: hypothetical protein COA47_00135 [Robiginitomaculum sp.]